MALPAAQADYLFVGELLRAKVQQLLGNDIGTAEADELVDVLQKDLARSTAFVVWNGERVSDEARGGGATLITQRWIVMLGIRSVRQAGGARNEAAGPWLARLHQGIAGWTPEGAGGRPFRRVTGPGPSYRPGAGFFPLTFSISLSL